MACFQSTRKEHSFREGERREAGRPSSPGSPGRQPKAGEGNKKQYSLFHFNDVDTVTNGPTDGRGHSFLGSLSIAVCLSVCLSVGLSASVSLGLPSLLISDNNLTVMKVFSV